MLSCEAYFLLVMHLINNVQLQMPDAIYIHLHVHVIRFIYQNYILILKRVYVISI